MLQRQGQTVLESPEHSLNQTFHLGAPGVNHPNFQFPHGLLDLGHRTRSYRAPGLSWSPLGGPGGGLWEALLSTYNYRGRPWSRM
jgi:hypothetical protein